MAKLSPERMAEKVVEYFCVKPSHGQRIKLSMAQVEKYFAMFDFYGSYFEGEKREALLAKLRSIEYLDFSE